MEDVEDLRSLGEVLRKAREEQGLSIEEAEGHTRIRRKYLEAFEIGNFSILPSPAHAKGFLRNYAAFLRLDAGAIVGKFSELSGVSTGTMTRPTGAQLRPPPPIQTRPGTGSYARPDTGRYDLQTGGSTYIPPERQVGPATPLPSQSIRRSSIPLPGNLASVLQGRADQPEEAQAEVEVPPAPRQQNPGAEGTLIARIVRSPYFTIGILLSGFVCVFLLVLLQVRGDQADVDSLPDGIAAEGDLPQAPDAVAGGTPMPAGTGTPEAPDVIEIPEILQGRVILSIEVTQRSWTRITVDDEVVYQELAQPGLVLQYEAENAIQVYTGNAEGLIVSYNGQELGPMGARGEIVDRTFSSEGTVIEPTPTPTVTPTNTAVPSPTLAGGANPDEAEQN